LFGSDPKSLVTLAHSPTPGRQCEVVMRTVTIKWKRKLQIEELVRIRNLCYLQKKKKKKPSEVFHDSTEGEEIVLLSLPLLRNLELTLLP